MRDEQAEEEFVPRMEKLSSEKRLERRKEELSRRRSRVRAMNQMSLGIGILVFVGIPAVIFGLGVSGSTIAILSLYAAMPIMMFVMSRGRLRDIDQELQTVDFDLDLLQFEVNVRETRAEKVLRINNLQLQRYYDLNLQQNIWVFALGIFCILLGLSVIGITLYLVLKVASDLDAKIITGVVGTIGSLLTNYVAAIYLKMHASASSHLGSFHQRLVETHQLLLGNLLASRIEDDDKRWDTLSKLSFQVSKPAGS